MAIKKPLKLVSTKTSIKKTVKAEIKTVAKVVKRFR